jgi:hypothetical protein
MSRASRISRDHPRSSHNRKGACLKINRPRNHNVPGEKTSHCTSAPHYNEGKLMK